MAKLNLDWDGEKIKQVVERHEKKVNTKDFLNSLKGIRNQINQMEGQKIQLGQQIKQVETNLTNAREDEKSLKAFEEKAIEIQKEKLKLLITQITEGCMNRATMSAKKTIDKDPNAYTEEQKKNMSYLDYQKYLATHEKIAEKISQHMITKFLYDEPIFDNPFKD